MPRISGSGVYIWAYAQTHVYNNSESMGFQWVLFVATDVDGSQYSDSLLESLKKLRNFLI